MSGPDDVRAIRLLRTPEAVRDRSKVVLAAAEAGLTPHFTVDRSRLAAAAHLVADVTRAAYPDLAIPLHSRWRHFAPDGHDRWQALRAQLDHADPVEVARIRVDLVIPSVLLDAGAGDLWRFVEPSNGRVFARSEGLALASLALFERGVLSSHPSRPLRADGAALRTLDARTLAEVFQVTPDNPLAGAAGRAALLNRLGATIALDPGRFGRPARLGHLVDWFGTLARGRRLPARTILIALLDALAPIWPGRILLAGQNLGDVGRHPIVRAPDATDGLVPFHKLSQWLAYSLIEPLEEAGIEVVELDALTGLAEYRNGGLLIDTGVLVAKQPERLLETQASDSEMVVEWRALTVALLDVLADEVRRLLGLDASALPLVKILQGGTWSAGRRIALERRPGGVPPLRTESDGTLF